MNLQESKLAHTITRKSSLQTYWTIRLLVKNSLVEDAYRAYAYFRWLDDQIDEVLVTKQERIAFIEHERQIIQEVYKGKPPKNLIPEETLLVSLINSDTQENSRLGSYITNFFSIIDFDARRKGELVSNKELIWYSETIGKAVTDCILYFVGEGIVINDQAMYKAATAAHLTHALRDMWEDIPEGFVNISKEYLDSHELSLALLTDESVRDWVKEQATKAGRLFSEGREYINKLTNFRCKLAATLYCLRFEPILKTISNDNYMVRKSYVEEKSVIAFFRYIIATLGLIWHHTVHHG